MKAYYNEFDPQAAAWLRELIKYGVIAPGDVDERSIEDVRPDELMGYTQCHFFAGIGVWSYALRQAGWPDDRPVWTGSCPCQPFSAAGKGAGFDDERHLWPAFHWLISQCRPPIVFGEQVASKATDPWIDLVQADVEALGYAFGCVPFPSAGVGAPHIRDRAFWVADSKGVGSGEGQPHRTGSLERSGEGQGAVIVGYDGTCRVADAEHHGRHRQAGFTSIADRDKPQQRLLDGDRTISSLVNPISTGLEGLSRHDDNSDQPGRIGENEGGSVAETGCAGGVAKPNGTGPQSGKRDDQGARHRDTASAKGIDDRHQPAGPTNGLWRDVDWLLCRDGKWRPVMPIHVKVVNGPASDMGRVCDSGQQTPQAKKEGQINESMQGMREAPSTKAVHQRCFGKSIHGGAEEVLRSEVYGEGTGEGTVRQLESQQEEVCARSQAVLRGLRESETSSCSPSGPGSVQQSVLELDDIVQLLPQSLSLAKLHGDRDTASALQLLQQPVKKARTLLHTPDTTKQVWASLGEEEKNRLRVGFDASRWQLVVPFSLVHKAPARVMRLRGYGNAINAEAARIFIESTMETRK